MVKWLVLILIFSLSCAKKVEDNHSAIIKFIYENKQVDPELWEIKLIKQEEISQTTYSKTYTRCTNLNVIYSIDLKENCYESKSILEENIITAQIAKAFDKEGKIYKTGKCYTTKDIAKNLEQWKEDQYKMIGQKVCVSYKHILLGGGCDKEVSVTKEMIDSDFVEVKKKSESDLDAKALHSAGEQHLESLNLNICRTSDDKLSLSL